MKKILITFLALLLCTALCACSNEQPPIDTNGDASSSNETDTSTTDTATNSDSYTHIMTLRYKFDSFDEIAELRSVLNMSDEEAEKYLYDNSWALVQLFNKKNVSDLYKILDNLNVFYIDPSSGYKLTFFEFNPTTQYFDYMYADASNNRIRCFIYLDNYSERTIDETVEATLNVSNNEIKLYDCSGDSTFDSFGELYTDRSLMQIYFSDNSNASTLSQYILLTTLSELIK